MMGYGDGMMGGWSPLWSGLGLIFVLAAIVAVTLLVIWLLRRSPSAPGGSAWGQEAGEILRRRFASGEIDDEEFKRRRATLEGP